MLLKELGGILLSIITARNILFNKLFLRRERILCEGHRVEVLPFDRGDRIGSVQEMAC